MPDSTPVTPPVKSTANIVAALSSANEIITLAAQAGGALEPLITGIIRSVKRTQGEGGDTETYEIVIQTGEQHLQSSVQNFEGALAKINAELVSQGKPPLAVPDVVP